MKIPLIMREQYQGQLSASMLYILLCRTGFMAGSFFLEKIILIRKTKKTPQKREIAAFSRTLQITGSNAFYRTLG